ncbi:MAG TPA: nucleotidyl transferase AbiEii/AbiGii toxin family protein [Myxococcota bacterium]|nr:nucleotidyl transferase AbiEii/AbiGii toxin family protein [Myxococcota bacterium]
MKNLSEEKILSRLKELSLETGLTVNDLRVVVALERAIARIEAEPSLAKSLIFKGGFLLFKSVDTTRYTRDVDALAQGISSEEVTKLMKFALKKDLGDCVWFADVQQASLPNQGPYGGISFSLAFQISTKPPHGRQLRKLSRIHIDVGFGDSILFSDKGSG